MKILCDNCGAKYSIADEKVAGKVFRIRCKKCTNVITVRGDQVAAEEEAAPQAFDYGGDQVWHVVVDGDQQGPFAPAQLGQMLTDGTIDWEAYVWKEGFDGWKPARDVPDLVAAITGEAPAEEAAAPAAVSQPPAAMAAEDPFAGDDTAGATPFGGAAAGDPFGGSADPFSGAGDAFAGEAARATEDAGADLFASGGDAFGGADDDVVASAPSPRVSGDQAMTGQRNENSVLFSLSNLQALATGGAESSGGGSMPPGPTAGHATGEGSGLIDIRALASATAATGGSGGSSGGGGSSDDVDDLLSIGGSGALGPALGAPVLAPAPAEPEKGGKGMVVGLALAGILVVGLLGALVFVITQQPAEQVAAAPVPAAATAGDPAAPSPAAAPAPAAATPATDEATGDDEATPEAAGDEDEAEPEGETSGRSGRRGSRMGRNRPSGSSTTSAMSDPDPPAVMTAPRNTSMDSLDDLLGAALGGSSMMSAPMMAAAMSNLPSQPSRDAVGSALRMVASRVSMCGGGMSGIAQSRVTFASSGRVRNVAVMGVSGPVQSCVSRAVRAATVPPFSQSTFNVNFPFRVQ